METSNSDITRRKLVIVGDGECGKTSLLHAFMTNTFESAYVPTIMESCAVDLVVGDRKVQMTLWDTAGQETYDCLRPICYPNTDIMLVTFSVDQRTSYENVRTKWIPELQHHCPSTPVMVVATKIDLRRDETHAGRHRRPSPSTVSHEEGLQLAKSVGAALYAECSAKTRVGVEDVFAAAALTALQTRRQKKDHQCVML